jgi:hypothetical protein
MAHKPSHREITGIDNDSHMTLPGYLDYIHTPLPTPIDGRNELCG